MKMKYFETSLANQNHIQEQIKEQIKFVEFLLHSRQTFCLPAYHVKYKTKAHKTITVLGFPLCEKIRNRGVWKYPDLRNRSDGSVETSNWGKGKTMLCLLNSAPCHENVWTNGSIDLILNLGNGMGWVVNFTPRLLYTPKKELPVPTEYEVQWVPSGSGCFEEAINLPPIGNITTIPRTSSL
jgi:hypothetical protein